MKRTIATLGFSFISILNINPAIKENCAAANNFLEKHSILQTQPESPLKGKNLIHSDGINAHKNYTSIIFDLGGVLLDNTQALSLAEKKWPNTQAATILLSLFSDPILKDLYQATFTVTQVAKKLHERYGYDEALTSDILNNLSTCLPLLPRGIEMLHVAKAQGYKIYLFTDIYQECLNKLKKEHQFFGLFDGIVASCEVGCDKSDIKIFQLLLNNYSIDPSKALLIDDTQSFVQTAESLGIDGVVCTDTKKIIDILREKNILKKKSPSQHSLGTRLIQSIPMQAKKYKALVFDLGQVLIKWQPEATAYDLFPGTTASSIMGALFNDPEWLNFDRNTIDINGLAKLAKEKYLFDEKLAQEVLSSLPQSLPIFQQLVDVMYAAKQEGYKLYVLSNMPQPYLEAFKKHHPFFNLFDGFVASYETGTLKPEENIYQTLFARYSLKPEDCLFIDDVDSNIIAGAKLGMDGIVCQNHDEVINILVKHKILSHVPNSKIEQSNQSQQI